MLSTSTTPTKAFPMSSQNLPDDEEPVIFQPDFTLKEKIGKDSSITELLRPEMLQMAQQVIQDSKKDFIGYMKEDILDIQKCLEKLQQTSWDANVLDHFMRLVLQIKARAGTFGYPLASEIARKLFVFCEDEYRAKSDHTLVMRKHVEGLSTVILKNIEGNGGPLGRELLASLDKLAQKLK